MEIQACKVSVWNLTEGLCQQIGQVGQTDGDLTGHGH